MNATIYAICTHVSAPKESGKSYRLTMLDLEGGQDTFQISTKVPPFTTQDLTPHHFVITDLALVNWQNVRFLSASAVTIVSDPKK